jgi:hypothetical protein
MTHYRVVVWIDHHVAHFYSITRDGVSEPVIIRAPDEGRGHIHHKAGSIASGHVAMSPIFLKEISGGLRKAREILIVGPADAKIALKKYIDLNVPTLTDRIRGVETMGRADKAEIHDFAVLFFRQHDLMSPQGN